MFRINKRSNILKLKKLFSRNPITPLELVSKNIGLDEEYITKHEMRNL